MTKLRMRVTGGQEIQRKLEQLPRDIAAGPMQEAVMAGAEVIKAQAKANADAIAVTGNLARNIFAELGKETIGERVVAEIGPGEDAWYGRLVEDGHAKVKPAQYKEYRTEQRLAKARGLPHDWSGGYVLPKPWLRPALDAKKQEARTRMAEVLDRRLRQIWKRW